MIPVFTSVVNVRSVRTKRSADLSFRAKDRVSTGIQIGQLRAPMRMTHWIADSAKLDLWRPFAHGSVYQNATTKAAVSTSKTPD